MVFVFFSILKCKTTRRDSRGSGGGYKKAHSISTFGKDLTAFTSSFSIGGSSKDVINNFVKTMKDKYNINVTVKE